MNICSCTKLKSRFRNSFERLRLIFFNWKMYQIEIETLNLFTYLLFALIVSKEDTLDRIFRILLISLVLFYV